MEIMLFAFVGFVVCGVCLPFLIEGGSRSGIVDQPNVRKVHSVATPIVGGIGVYASFALVSLFAPVEAVSVSLLAWIGLVVVIGVADDLFDISYLVRIVVHTAIVFGILFTDKMAVVELGALTGGDSVRLVGFTAFLFTAIAVIGAVNTINMCDGIDGLLGFLCLISLAFLFWFSWKATEVADSTGSSHRVTPTGIAIQIGTLVAFLMFNCRFLWLNEARTFMGDAGSTAIGFLLVYLLIDYSQGTGAVISPVVAGWIIGLPLLDGSGVIIHRALSRRSPFAPDRTHIHHLLMIGGLTVNQTVCTLITAHTFMIGFAVLAFQVFGPTAEPYLFWFFVILVLCRILVAAHFENQSSVSLEKPDTAAAAIVGVKDDKVSTNFRKTETTSG